MSSDLLVRVLIVAGIVVMALAVAYGVPRFAAFRAGRRPLEISDLTGDVLLFSSRSCSRCDQVRSLLQSEGVEFGELEYEEHTGAWEVWGIPAVPMLVVRRAASDVTLAGPVSRRRLRRALAGK